jgi:hypothetical protein
LLLAAEFCAHGSLYDLLRGAAQEAELAAALTWRRRLAMVRLLRLLLARLQIWLSGGHRTAASQATVRQLQQPAACLQWRNALHVVSCRLCWLAGPWCRLWMPPPACSTCTAALLRSSIET